MTSDGEGDVQSSITLLDVPLIEPSSGARQTSLFLYLILDLIYFLTFLEVFVSERKTKNFIVRLPLINKK